MLIVPFIQKNCFGQILSPNDQFAALYQLLGVSNAPKTLVLGTMTASDTDTIPQGATSYRIAVTGANATIGGTAVGTGTVVEGNGPLAEDLALVTGATTTVIFSYETTV